MRHDAADAGILDGRARPPAGEHVVCAAIVVGFAVGHGANDANFVGYFCGLFEMLRKMNAFDVGFDRSQRTPIFDGSKHFGIERFLRGYATGKEDVNNGLRGRFGTGGLSLKLKEISKCKANAANETDEKKLATIGPPNMFGAVAEAGDIVFHTKRPVRLQ